MVPVGRGVQQEYQNMQQSFTCCVGSGMESHALHGDGIYYESDDTLWVNLFVPSTARFTTGDVHLTMETGFPDGDSAAMTLRLPEPRALTLAVRRPHWAGDGFRVRVNGQIVDQPPLASLRAGTAGGRNAPNEDTGRDAGSYVALARTWRSGDRVELDLPKSLRLEPTPDNGSVAAILWGPLVLAGDMGPRREGRAQAEKHAVPVLVTAGGPVAEWVSPAGTRPGDFVARQVARIPAAPAPPADVALTPFHRTHRRSYSVYFDVVGPADFDARVAALAAERERVAKLEAATVTFVQPGTPESERAYGYRSEPTDRPVQRGGGRTARAGQGWFSYELPVEPGPMALVVTFRNEPGVPPPPSDFEILIEGTSVGRVALDAGAWEFYETRYDLPAPVTTGKPRVTVRFQAVGTGTTARIAPVYGVRVIRAG
jgi:hypothetical protein